MPRRKAFPMAVSCAGAPFVGESRCRIDAQQAGVRRSLIRGSGSRVRCFRRDAFRSARPDGIPGTPMLLA